MDEVQRLARVSTLLDEIAEEAVDQAAVTGSSAQGARIVSKVREAQRVLLGDAPTDDRDN
jgi:hypothetical protein